MFRTCSIILVLHAAVWFQQYILSTRWQDAICGLKVLYWILLISAGKRASTQIFSNTKRTLQQLHMCLLLQVTDRTSAERLVMLAPKEWEAGRVRIKHLASREEEDVLFADLSCATE